MQLTHFNKKIVDRIVRDGQGRLVRATFAVYEQNGRIKARLIEAVVIEHTPEIENKVFALGTFAPQSSEYSEQIVYPKIVSPYFSNLLYVSGSQPRAPTI